MEERIKLKPIIKSDNLKELIDDLHSSSSEDEIQFYFNDTQYVSAKDDYDGTFQLILEKMKKILVRKLIKINLKINFQ